MVDAKSQEKGAAGGDAPSSTLFTNETKAIVWGMQNRAVQGMLDFDHVCSRKSPSVVAMTYPLMYVPNLYPPKCQ